ncbi:hypothetical protein [Brevundimonas naejangsanensis]|uniref:hypothetical protein n=1 Tax=Brevundimonas naejangsanensis TaxID=588932 RepID=UPI0013C40C61|nr:hypothetical protein [Brevundimonas naejangsanensis]
MSGKLKGGPAHYRLSRATWEIILDEYRNGATVPELSERWRVSGHALRKRITVHGATKRDWGDQIAIETAKARAAAQEAAETAKAAADAAAEAALVQALFAPLTAEGAHEGKAVALASTAMIASGRAMLMRRLPEAQGLARLAEVYLRLMDRQEKANTLENTPLEVLLAARFNGEMMSARFAMTPESKYDDPEYELKSLYWSQLATEKNFHLDELMAARREADQAGRELREAKAALEALKAAAARS